MKSRPLCLLIVLGTWSLSTRAADEAPAEFEVAPRIVALHGSRARQQLLATALFADGSTGDVTRNAQYESLAPTIALVDARGLIVPRGEGTAEIVVRHSGREQRIQVTVTGFGLADPIDFNTQTIAAISKAGCNQGACHGSPQGKGGFRLSLRGFDPTLDLVTLVREEFGRRTNPFTPDNSLVLQKGLREVPHQGGLRFRNTDASYQTLRAWIAEGCRPSAVARRLERLEVLPGGGRIAESHPRQQLVALAHFDDGTVRDVTDLAVFTSSEPTAAPIGEDGVADFQGTIEAAFLVRYLDRISSTRLTYVKRDPAYQFAGPPEANFVDRFVFAKQRSLQLLPAALADDATFLRRVYLDVIGTLPTAEEARRFLDSTAADKRARLIDELLTREEFAYFWALKWADVMRGSDVTISKRGVHSFHRYLVHNFRDDRPFDDFARETLTSLGNTLHKPAANFYRIARTPDEAAEAMAQLFLGVRIGCAKCHNHPFEAITQDDYYGLAAYFARVRYKGKLFMVDDETVFLERSGEVRHPLKNKDMAPIALGEPAVDLLPDEDRRQRLADWLTRPDNKYFAPSVVNRVWFHLFGRGIVDPVDDLRDTNPAADAELLKALAAEFVQQGYRIRPVLRLILNSHTYQLSAVPVKQSPLAAPEERFFTHAAVHMLSAEQMLDAITSVTGIPEEFPGYPRGTRAIELAEGAVDHPFLKSFSKPVRDVTCECAREDDPSLSQVIHLLNNSHIVGGIKSAAGRVSRWLAEGKSDADLAETMFLATLSRRPTAAEMQLVQEHVRQAVDRAAAFYDLQHALMNSNEFLLRH